MTSKSDRHPRSSGALAVFCRSCSSPLVQASGWAKQEESWRVRLWCPECWHEQTVVLDKAQAAYLSLAVEEGFACVLETFAGIDAMETFEPGTRGGRRPH